MSTVTIPEAMKIMGVSKNTVRNYLDRGILEWTVRQPVTRITEESVKAAVGMRPSPRLPDMEQRFWASVNRLGDDECWEWQGQRNVGGYGTFCEPKSGDNRRVSAHRYSAKLHFGMFDERLYVCHHCDNPPCVNPAHLYLGTAADNARDAKERGRLADQTRTHCKRGHELVEGNLYWNSRGNRQCRTCVLANTAAWKAARKAEATR